MKWSRDQVTPVIAIAYRGVFEVKQIEMSEQGQWTRMAAQMPDDLLDLFVARATYDNPPAAIERATAVPSIRFRSICVWNQRSRTARNDPSCSAYA